MNLAFIYIGLQEREINLLLSGIAKGFLLPSEHKSPILQEAGFANSDN